MEDWGRVILSPEAASARFHDKVLVLAAGAEPVTVSRSVLYCTVLYCTVLYFTVLYCTGACRAR